MRYINGTVHHGPSPLTVIIDAGPPVANQSTVADLGLLLASTENNFTLIPRDAWGYALTTSWRENLTDRLDAYISGDPDATISWTVHPSVSGAYRASVRPYLSSARMRALQPDDSDFLSSAKVTSFSSILVVTLDGEDISGSPMEVVVGPSSGYGPLSVVSGDGSVEATVAREASFHITLYDRLQNPRLDWAEGDSVECLVSSNGSSHVVPIECVFTNTTQLWACRYTPIISGVLRIQCRVNNDLVMVGTAESFTVTVRPHPAAPEGAALNASFSVYSPSTGHVWPDAYRKDEDPPQKLGLWYEDIYGNRLVGDLTVAMMCTADYPARLGEIGVGDTRSQFYRKRIGPVSVRSYQGELSTSSDSTRFDHRPL